MSLVSYGLAQGLQRTTVTRRLVARPDMFEGRSRYNSLSPRGRPSGWLCAEEGPTAIILKGPVQLRESFSLRTLFIGAFAKSLSGCGGCVVDPYPASSVVFGSAQEGVR